MIKILLIEDNSFIVDIYKRSFDAWNKTHNQNLYEVSVASDGETGLQKALTEQFNIILLDILLPNKSGIDVLKELRVNTNTKLTPVCMLTNLSDDKVMNEAYKLGALGYVVKSDFTPEQIVEQIQNFINQSQK